MHYRAFFTTTLLLGSTFFSIPLDIVAEEGAAARSYVSQKLTFGSRDVTTPHASTTQDVAPASVDNRFPQWFSLAPSIYQQYQADPHQIGIGAAKRFNDRILNTNIGFVTFGAVMPVYRCECYSGEWDMEIGVMGNMWGVFDLEAASLDLINTDWLGGIPVAIRRGPLGLRARLYHISSHLGDEYLLRDPAPVRVNPSYEVLDLAVDYQLRESTRLYAQLSRLLHHDKSYSMQPLQIEVGGEYWAKNQKVGPFAMQPFVATHLRMQEVHSMSADVSIIAGLKWCASMKQKSANFVTQIEIYDGYSYEGQFGHDKTKYIALSLKYGI